MIADFGTLTLARRVKFPKFAIMTPEVPHAEPATRPRRLVTDRRLPSVTARPRRVPAHAGSTVNTQMISSSLWECHAHPKPLTTWHRVLTDDRRTLGVVRAT